MSFKNFDLPDTLFQQLERIAITTPTPIQLKAIPVALQGHDILASAQTGTGKTIAYLLPLIAKLQDNASASALILAPTRELADQIKAALQQLLSRSAKNDIALLIGGAPIYKQFTMLRRNPRYIIGTPGRINDHLSRGTLCLRETRILVLDETDRMLDMGFSEDLEKIAKHLPKERQTMMFSATMPANIIKLSHKYLSNPQQITIGTTTQPAAKISQKAVQTSSKDKFSHLLKELSEREGSIVIFVKTKIGAAQLADKLVRQNHSADAIHGDLKQRQRDDVIRGFRNSRYRIMVATDIAARGLDIPHVKHVINYDLPQCAEDYIHRIGRTGRAGMEGHALSLISPEDIRKWKVIDNLIHPNNAKKGKKPSEPNSHQNRPRRNKRRAPDQARSRKPPHRRESRESTRQS